MGDDHDDGDNGEVFGLLPFDDGSTGRLIRCEWHDGRWFFSVIDVIAILTDSSDPGAYWRKLKQRLREDEGASETVTKCHELKMRALDGKMRATDAADTETMLRIVQSVPSPKAEPIKQWLAHEGAKRLDEKIDELPEDHQRLLLRREMADRNSALAETAKDAGIITTRDFAIFQDFGYKGLYGGESAKDIAARKGLSKGQHILDWMESEELGDNIFRAVQTRAKLVRLQQEGDVTRANANATHFTVGREVRAAIERIGGTMPEDLPTPTESIQQFEQTEQAKVKAQLQPPLFQQDVPEK